MAAGRVIDAIAARNAELAATEHPWVGAETYFLGEVHSGDFYNRFPTECRLDRHPPLGARQHARGGRGRVPRAARRRSRPRPAARSSSTSGSSAVPTRSTPSTQLALALRAGYADVTGTRAAADGDQGRRGRRGVPGRGGDPDRLPRPGRHAARTATSSSCPIAELVRATQVYLRDAPAPVGGVSARTPSYDELRASFRWELPAVVNIGVEVSDRQPRQRRRSSSRTGARSPARSPSAS